MFFQVAGALLGIAGGIMGARAQASSAKLEAAVNKFQIEMQNKQLKLENDILDQQAQQASVMRMEQARKVEETNIAAMSAMGVGENISYAQGIRPANEKALRRDILTMKSNLAFSQYRVSDQIRINNIQAAAGVAGAQMKGNAAIAGAWMKGAAIAIDTAGDIAAKAFGGR